MTPEHYDISIVVPTVGERDDLFSCLESIDCQTYEPAELIIVNDGEFDSETRQWIDEMLSLEVVVTSSNGPPGTSTARNTGARKASSEVVLILDDDVVIGPDYLNRLQNLYEEHDDASLAGIGGFDSSLRKPSRIERWFHRFFFLGGDTWRLNEVGMQSWDPSLQRVSRAEWLSGNNASYKREILLENPFPHWSGGREPLEDIAMGMQLKEEGYHVLIDPQLPVEHNEREDSETSIEFGVKRGKNRVRIFRRHGPKVYLPLFLWALIGDTLRQFAAPLSDSNWKSHWLTGFGMIIGAVSELAVSARRWFREMLSSRG